MDNHIITTLPNEADDLALHVEICHQRYLQLIRKLDDADNRLDNMNETLIEIKENLETQQSKQLKAYLSLATTVIIAMGGWIIHLLVK